MIYLRLFPIDVDASCQLGADLVSHMEALDFVLVLDHTPWGAESELTGELIVMGGQLFPGVVRVRRFAFRASRDTGSGSVRARRA